MTMSQTLNALIPEMPVLVGIGIVSGLVFFCLERFLGIKKDSAEPPFVPAPIPYLGHLWGILFNQIAYYAKLNAKYGHKIYSLAMPAGRIYIANSPEIITAMQKVPRVVSFWFIEASLTKNLGGISDYANNILLENARGEKGENSLVVDGMKVTHKAMSGEYVETMTLAAIQRAGKELSKIEASGTEYDLWDWVQRLFSLAVSTSVYGPANPYEDRKLERGLSEFADHTPTFLTGLPPWLFVPKAYAARESIVASFQKYFAEKHDLDAGASELVRVRAQVLREYGIPEPDIARFESVNGFGILLNLLPTAFWTLYHIFADPELLAAVRREAAAALPENNAFALPEKVEELASIDQLPLTTSAMKESLRFHASGTAARMIMEDHKLDGKYLLKRDSYIFVPNKSPHFDSSAWTSPVEQFKADRFDKTAGDKMHPAAFRGFGGGVNLCPGRAFSTRLIVCVVAALALKFDVHPVAEGGKWIDPGHDERSMAIVLARPSRKIRARVVPRRART